MNKRKLDGGGGDSGAENDEDGAKRAKSDNDEEDDGGNGGGCINHSNVNSNVSSTSPPHQQASCPGFSPRLTVYVMYSLRRLVVKKV